ncbi:cyclic AMP-responsive element-binding protein 5-like isoform X2 [Nelusetta ayraudi]|uniref:cyclic AMP-responsive element-binding protein 5-like isoform X2 n=1 Tax=Nelusetta ayraudi TaxID=303726 RepID=UPI003F700AC2
MSHKHDRPYVCGAPGCSQRFQSEEHLMVHRHKHQMTLKFSSNKTDTAAFTDETPTPTRFLQNCEEVGLFKEIEEEFLQAEEEEKSKQMLRLNGATSCMNQLQLRPQTPLQLHPQAPPLQHRPLLGPSCSLAAQQNLPSSSSSSSSSSQTGPVHPPQALHSGLAHSGPAPGPPTSSSSLLHMRHRHRQPLAASLPGTLPDPAMQGASAQHRPAAARSKQPLGPHFQQQQQQQQQQQLQDLSSMAHMMEMMSQRHQAPPLQHHQHHHHHHHQAHQHHHHQPPHPHPSSQLTAPALTYQQQRGHAPPPSQHQSPPHRLHQASPPAPPLSVPPQLSPVTPHIPLPLSAQAGGSCSGGAGGGVGSGPGRRRRTVDHDPDERRQKFLERNRAAATRCRQKRKLWVSSLEKKAEELTHTNLQLQNEVTSLRSEVGQLKQILQTHKDCPVTARQREAQGYPSE